MVFWIRNCAHMTMDFQISMQKYWILNPNYFSIIQIEFQFQVSRVDFYSVVFFLSEPEITEIHKMRWKIFLKKLITHPKSLKIIATRFWAQSFDWSCLWIFLNGVQQIEKKLVEIRCKWSIVRDNCKTCLAFYIGIDHQYYQIKHSANKQE